VTSLLVEYLKNRHLNSVQKSSPNIVNAPPHFAQKTLLM